MNMMLKRLLASVVASTLFVAASASAAKIGAKAPDFTLKDLDGETHSLSDFEGKVVVLEWTNYGCPFVKKHYNSGNMQGLQEYATGKDMVWLTICSSASGKQGHMNASDWKRESSKKEVQSTAILLDESGEVGRSYGAKVTPHMFVINEDGVLVYDGAIDSIPTANTSDLAKAENYVRSAIDAVLAKRSVETKTSKPYGCGIKYSRDS